jgi:DNA modification methylase
MDKATVHISIVWKTMIEFGDCRETMRRWKEQGVKAQTCVTSPPYYGLRDYGHDGQIGLEETPEQYIKAMVEVFRCVWDVLEDDGTLWLNIGDSYAGSGKGSNPDGTPHPSTLLGKQGTNTGTVTGKNMPQKAHKIGLKPKDLIGIPWMLAFALRADGWYLRQDIIWHKPNPMPESVQDRCTKAHEYIFLLSKSQSYYFDNDAIKYPVKQDWGTRDRSDGKYHNEGSGLQPHGGLEKSYEMANKRSVWTVTTKPYKGAHFATFPPDLIEPCILAGAPVGGIVLDPFMGSGTTAAVAIANGRNYFGCELNPAYKELQDIRIRDAHLGTAQMELI